MNQNKKIKIFLRCFSITVKEGKRRRYIGFEIRYFSKDAHVEKNELIQEIRKQCKDLFKNDCKSMGIYLIRFNGEQGIVKCNHVEKENMIKLLKSIRQVSSVKLEIETLGTSGTIKTLIKKHMKQ